MTPLLTKWREQEEEFEKKYPDLALRSDYNVSSTVVNGMVKSFHRQSLIAIIEGEIERLEGNKKQHDPDDEVSKWHYEKNGFNAAIDQQISYWKSNLEGLKKL